MMLKYYFYGAFGLALALLAGWGWQGHQTGLRQAETIKLVGGQLKDTKASLKASDEANALLQETLKSHAAELARQRVIAASARKALNDALKDNRTWADAPVPDSVQRALKGPGAPGAEPPAPIKPAG